MTTVGAPISFIGVVSDRRPAKRALLALLVVTLMTGCPGKTRDEAAQEVTGQRLAIRELSRDVRIRTFLQEFPNAKEPRRLAIRDDSSWRSFWTTLRENVRKPVLERVPPVDFAREMLIVAVHGEDNGGAGIAIPEVVLRRDTLVAVVVSITGIYPSCRTDARVTPVAIVRVPRSERPLTFIERTEERECAP
jgi:hypothetical protein